MPIQKRLKLAKEGDDAAIMDEVYGRKVAEVEGIDTRVTAFLVVKFLTENLISKERVIEIVDHIIEESYHCSKELYKDMAKK